MPRWSVLMLCAATVLVAGASGLTWTVATPWAVALADRALAPYGLALDAAGPVELSLLPAPALSFAGIRLRSRDHLLAEGGTMQVQFGLGGLVFGRAEVAAVALSGTRFTLPEEPDWAAPGADLLDRLPESSERLFPRRLVLTDASLTVPDARTGLGETVSGLNLVATWPRASSGLSVTASLVWRGIPATVAVSGLRPAALAAGEASPFVASATWAAASPGAGSLDLEGTGQWQAGPRLSGSGRLLTASLPDTLDWLGGRLPLAPLVGAMSLEGRFESRPDRIELPDLRIGLGGNSLEGAGAVVLGGGRPAVSATLAAERFELDLPPGSLAGWERRSLDLAPYTGGDLDLRLSIGAARLGTLGAEDVAGGLLIRDGVVEATLGRATVRGGTVKGRATLVSGSAGLDAKAQGSLDRVDLGAVLADLGAPRWLLGRARGTLSLEGSGWDLSEISRRVAGRASLTLDGGEILGLGLADMSHRTGAALRRGGRTPFERAQVTLSLSDGVGDIVQGQIRGSAVAAGLRGRVWLPDRRLGLWVEIEPRLPAGADTAAGLVEISGPWAEPAIRLVPTRNPGLPAAASAYAP
ncbi:AsmA family protein [Methylobacterium oryzihabitans]|uniref:AsmA family protein n=1 Tax=Methylobacterium oryzihabitans TaxID=2499852 RepID=A0A3S2VZQ7_9HYPH|nr:AsmA-like C-terminal region-containing protein [Methylobacterium oryzihabitans]RVU21585.1 AsmA family protein [Methylobacterium oryzihabitans]